jgi:hypothetical protein
MWQVSPKAYTLFVFTDSFGVEVTVKDEFLDRSLI